MQMIHTPFSAQSNIIHFSFLWQRNVIFILWPKMRHRTPKPPSFIVAGCGLPSCWACFDWDRGVGLPHISFCSLRGIHHPVKSRQFYGVVCESAYNPHNSVAHLRPMYPNVQLNNQTSLQLAIPSQIQWPKPSLTQCSHPWKVISLLSFTWRHVGLQLSN